MNELINVFECISEANTSVMCSSASWAKAHHTPGEQCQVMSCYVM